MSYHYNHLGKVKYDWKFIAFSHLFEVLGCHLGPKMGLLMKVAPFWPPLQSSPTQHCIPLAFLFALTNQANNFIWALPCNWFSNINYNHIKKEYYCWRHVPKFSSLQSHKKLKPQQIRNIFSPLWGFWTIVSGPKMGFLATKALFCVPLASLHYVDVESNLVVTLVAKT